MSQETAQEQEDGHRPVWTDNDWSLDGLPEVDWPRLDELQGADGTFGPHEPPPFYSSSTFDEGSPASQDFSDARASNSQPHDSLGTTVTAPMGNAASASSNRQLSNSQSHAFTASPTQTHQRRPSLTRRLPAPNHSENWLDRSARERQSPFGSYGYIPDDLFDSLSDSQSPATISDDTEAMPTAMRRRGQRNSIVDLTADPSSPQAETSRAPRSLKRSAEDAQSGRTKKRSKRSSQNIDELDMTNEAPSAEDELRQAQQQDAIKAQQANEESEGPQKIGKRTCIICMEPYTNVTVTLCGHIYCHECLTQALIVGEKNGDRGTGNCPVCRKPLKRGGKTPQLVPLAFMKKSAFKGKAKSGLSSLPPY